MSLFSRLRELLAVAAESDATRPGDPEDLFQLTGASVTMEADLGYPPMLVAGLCFSAMDATDFRDAIRDVEAVLEGDGFSDVRVDGHGYTWAVAEREEFESLVTDLYVAADTLEERGYGNRVLAAVFAFESESGDGADGDTDADSDTDAGRERVYWVYSFRRGSFYPFAPRAGNERDSTLEVKLQSVLDGELDVEDDTAYWYPLWPDRDGGHPWE
jgi:hypothetical protein